LLRKPRKSSVNSADYTERYVEQIQLIKDLRENYYLPIPEIKKIVRNFKKQTPSDQAISQFHSKFLRPVDRLLPGEICGREAFLKITGMGRKWLSKAEEWGLLTPDVREGQAVFSADDVAIGKLMVDMDRLGFGPKHGHDPADLRYISDFVRGYVVNSIKKYYHNNLEKLSSEDFAEKGSQFHEVISLFFYHLYRKFVRKEVQRLLDEMVPGNTGTAD